MADIEAERGRRGPNREQRLRRKYIQNKAKAAGLLLSNEKELIDDDFANRVFETLNGTKDFGTTMGFPEGTVLGIIGKLLEDRYSLQRVSGINLPFIFQLFAVQLFP